MNLNVITEKDAVVMTDKVKASTTAKVAKRGTRKTGQTPQVTEDDLYTKLLKYIPTPLVGLYLLLQNGALAAFDDGTKKAVTWVLFVIFTLAVIPFLLNRKVVRKSQIAISVVAFVAWAIASPGPFQLISGWNEFYGTLALGLAILGLIVFQMKPLPQAVLDETIKPES